MEANDFYELGKRDAFCDIFMWLRTSSDQEVLKAIAEKLKGNPHADFYLKRKVA